MAVLVDDAAWPWRGERWAHLVSDRDLTELHVFASALGVPRLGFQGDHYDIPARLRDRALAIGARAVTSRELLRAIRDAGLRVRGPLRWEEIDVDHPDAVAARETATAWWPALGALAWTTVLRRPEEVGLRAVLDGPGRVGPVPMELARRGIISLVEHREVLMVDVVVPRA